MEEALTKIALAISATAAIHEGSWTPNPDQESIIKGSYTIPLRDAAEKSSPHPDVQHLAYLLCATCWNDALGWAKERIGSQRKV